jgi:hypothetical protein
MASFRQIWQRIASLGAGRTAPPARRGPHNRRRPCLEQLEDRQLLSGTPYPLPSYCNLTSNPGYTESTWAQIQSGCQQIRNYNASLGQQQPQQPQSPVQPTQPQSGLQSYQQRLQQAINLARQARAGKNGYLIYYNRPPIYQGGSYTPAARPFHATRAQAARVIKMLLNNGNQITGIYPW